jgi:hypothetical protein
MTKVEPPIPLMARMKILDSGKALQNQRRNSSSSVRIRVIRGSLPPSPP